MSRPDVTLVSALMSPVGRKVLTGVTGIGLVAFVIVHMIGNLSYLSPDPQAYNVYAHKLMSLGWLLYTVEIGLALCFLLHAIVGVSIQVRRRKARPVGYKAYKSSGSPSRSGYSARSMIFTGIILLGFLILHLNSFKFGPGEAEGYTAILQSGEEVRDLRRLMTEKFREPLYAFGYPVVMVLLGMHMRHGVWSALQSLGMMSRRLSPYIYAFAALLGALVAIGFLVVPLYIFFSA